VVWIGYGDRRDGGASWQVYSNFGGQLSSGSYANQRPDISATNVVWEGGPYGGTHLEIFSNFAGPLNPYDRNNWYPAISGTNVVWGASPGGGSATEVYSNFAGVLATNTLEPHPDISGTNVVWQGSSGGIYSNFAGQIAGGWTFSSVISGTNVAWYDSGLGIVTNFGGSIGEHNLYQANGRMGSFDVSGTTVVWDGWDGSDREIYMATYTPNVVPLPGAVLLVGIGVGSVDWLRRRRIL
jgi:hypothetical protein